MKTLQSSGNREADLADEIGDLGPWFHNLHLPDGTQTAPDHPLGDFPRFKWQKLAPHLPEDLSGWRALDIGCNAGFYSFELADRGAEVLGIDVDPHYLEQAEWARAHYGFGDQVSFRQMQVYELTRLKEDFDLILFMGVFYHLRYPQLALDIVAEKARKMLVFQSLSYGDEAIEERTDGFGMEERERMERPGWPKMAFIERTFQGDPTNWWVPNHAAMVAMLHDVGFEIEAHPAHEMYVCRKDADREATTLRHTGELESVTGRGWLDR